MKDTFTLPNGETITLPDPDAIFGYARLTRWPGMDVTAVRLMFARYDIFPSICQIQREDSTQGYMHLTPVQHRVLQQAWEHKWGIVNKYRQAKMTTVLLMTMLRDCMYLSGHNGVLVAQRGQTVKSLFRRLVFAYNQLDPRIRAPLDPKRNGQAMALYFEHGGSIEIWSAGSDQVGVGESPDRMIFSEIGEVRDLETAAMQMFPGITKRPNARAWIESTPGPMGGHYYKMWKEALRSGDDVFEGRYVHPIFLQWWKDETCWLDPTGFEPTPDEIEYMNKCPGMNFGNLAFRRFNMRQFFGNDPVRFSAKFPIHEEDGWLGADNPVLPGQQLVDLLATARPDPALDPEIGVRPLVPRDPFADYIILVDPHKQGAEGDVGALTVMEPFNLEEVAVWEGREDNALFADRVERAAAYYNNALVVVESNAEALVITLRDRGNVNLYWQSPTHAGWYASDKSLKRAVGRATDLLNEKSLVLHSYETISQLMRWDGSKKDHRLATSGGNTRHFDRARTIIMFCDVWYDRGPWKEPAIARKRADSADYSNGVPWRDANGNLVVNALKRDHTTPRRLGQPLRRS